MRLHRKFEGYMIVKSLWVNTTSPPDIESVREAACECLEPNKYEKGTFLSRSIGKGKKHIMSDNSDNSSDSVGDSDDSDNSDEEENLAPPARYIQRNSEGESYREKHTRCERRAHQLSTTF